MKAPDYTDYTLLDGYAWAEQQAHSVHGPLHVDESIGDWPYLVVARGARDDKYIIKEFCEHDVKTWVYQENERDEYTAHLEYMRKEMAAV